MLCPRCSMHMPGGSLVCARCGELTPHPTGLPFDTNPPAEGPRASPLLARDVPIDRRGRGVRAIGPLGQVKVRPAQVQWARGRDLRDDRRTRAAVPDPVPAPRREPLPSAVHQAKTDPQWLAQPVSGPAISLPPAPAEPESPSEADVSDAVLRAPHGRRALAAAVDLAVVLGVVLLGTAFGLALFGWDEISLHFERGFDDVFDGLLVGRGLGLVLVGLGVVVSAAYSVVGHALGGATLGKRLAGVRVVDAEGEPPSLSVSFWRMLGAGLSAALGGLGFALALFHPDGLALHDHVVGTRVVPAGEPD